LGEENITDGFGVVNMLVVGIAVVFVSLNGTEPSMTVGVKASVAPDCGALVVTILGVVDLESK